MGQRQLMAVGEKLRSARHEQGLSLRELASRADVSASLLSQVESGKVMPSAATLYRIATALSLPVHAFFPPTTQQVDKEEDNRLQAASTQLKIMEQPLTYAALENRAPASSDIEDTQAISGPVVHPETRKVLELAGGIKWARLTPGSEEGMEFLEISYVPGYDSGPEMLYHTGREFGIVIEGEAIIELGFERYQLKPGDSIVYDSTTPHRVINTYEGRTRMLWVRFTPHTRPTRNPES
ncbi:cupin domain-containing protein [Ktedonosporobacter rubrisoli]|uniref:Cupin domain-containing protein n=1 Tax=Ktedonosporobacter rubrisoli TaxID=2509675 RepID=A0A4P6K2U4_KTERU|nr:cupin domain-containing protein [Ktedonosporobacter rubrisoli]QBD82242.1 cupin domain-containing protein [Ktedonosporobacter rubrisoli]